MVFAEKNTFFKIIALFLIVLSLLRPSAMLQTELPFEDFTSSSKEVPSSLSALPVEMAFSRDTTFDALLKQESDTCKLCFHIITTALLSILLCLIFSKTKYIHHTKTERLLI